MAQVSARRFLLIGDNRAARQLHESFQQLAPYHWKWLGVVADGPVSADLGKNLGVTHDLEEIVSRYRPTDLVVAIQSPGLTLCKTLLHLGEGGIRIATARTLNEELTHRVSFLGEDPWDISLGRLSFQGRWTRSAKRTLDVIVGTCAFLALVLVLLPVALGLMLEGAGSVFVRERRVGYLGQPFTLLRFRTTRWGASGRRWPFVDPPTLVRTGAVIQRFGVDRLPQSLAILAGHLSLVGPRPADVEYHQRIERELPIFLARTVMKPGLIGWAQLHRESRSNLDTLRQLEYDLYYIKYQSLGLDLRIITRTALVFLGVRGTGN